MSAKTSKARTEAFFTALAETGNQTISAERARVSRSWVTLHRSTDPAFKARMEACIVEARVRLSRAGAVTSDGKWANINGEKLVVRGSRGRRAQISRARLKQWTAAEEGRFLAALSATANVNMACEAVGLSVPSAYMHAERWPGFAAAWQDALLDGYPALEAAMLQNALRHFGPEEPDAADGAAAFPITPMTAQHAMALIDIHKRHTARARLDASPEFQEQDQRERDANVKKLLGNLRALKRRLDAGEE